MTAKVASCSSSKETLIRDYLAFERTSLANERTILSYVRTAIAFGGAGAGAIHFSSDGFVLILGCIFIFSGFCFGINGALKFIKSHSLYRNILKDYESKIEELDLESSIRPSHSLHELD